MAKPKSVTITYAELKAFSDTIDENWYFEEDGTIPEEFWEGKMDPADKITIEDGEIYIVWQGDGQPPTDEDREFVAEFRKWKTGLDYVIMAIRVEKKDKDRISKLLKENKIKILSGN
jgi:hypothetical protein